MAPIVKKIKRKIKRTFFGKQKAGPEQRVQRVAERNRPWAEVNAPELAAELETRGGVKPESFLFITLDSCRYDTFANADIPNLKGIGEWYEAEAPAAFTFPSHMAMFIGFTPGVASSREPIRNPKAGRIWRMSNKEGGEKDTDYMRVPGANIFDGFNQMGYHTIGVAAMSWFNDRMPTTKPLVTYFKDFLYTYTDVDAQVGFSLKKLQAHINKPVFSFINVGETHVPYHHRGAPWPITENPCIPFRDDNSRELSQERQRKCLEYADRKLGPIIKLFQKSGASIVVCGDHGDCHGEDGLWAHGFYHEKVLKVPMVYHLRPR